MKLFRFTLRRRNNFLGYMFIMPFILGFLLFTLAPILQSFMLSINNVVITQTGYELEYIGFENYYFSLRVHNDYIRILANVVGVMLMNVFWVLIFSFFAALLLNQQFPCRLFFRVVFFLPVVMASGVILHLEVQDYFMAIIGEQVQETYSFINYTELKAFLTQMQIPAGFVEAIAWAVEGIPSIINASGIQILVFLAGLQGISPSLYEASQVEGATAWENFWLITFPMVSPLIMTNIIYTILDFFGSQSNAMVQLIRNTTFQGAGFGVSAAMAWIYFASICVILLVIYLLIDRLVFYHD